MRATLRIMAHALALLALVLFQDDPAPVVTQHAVTIGGVEIEYDASAGRLAMKDEEAKKKADLFYVSYVKRGVADPAERAVTFAFNGGPGSSSVWLHLGALGPRRVEMGPEGFAPPPPYRLVDNGESWLDVTDLVFIDPVTTGYSRPATGEDPGQFHGFEGDVQWVGEFIRLWLSHNQRWASPKFLAGESYGTTRAAGLSGFLQDRHGVYLNGIVLVSSVLNFQTTHFDSGNDLPYALFLPTYAATAWYHGALAPEQQRDLDHLLVEVETFAAGEYTLALMKGDALGEAERESVLAKLERYTGLGRDYLEATDLRIQQDRFCKELLRAKRRTVGRLDSRFTGIDADAAGDGTSYDPSYAAIQGPFSGALNDYVRRELGFASDLPYEILTGRVHPWDLGAENSYLDVAKTLRAAMTENPSLQVLVASGFYDMATPYFATRYTFDHLGLDPSLRAHVRIRHYESGHMMYIHPPSLAALHRDVVQFVADATAR